MNRIKFVLAALFLCSPLAANDWPMTRFNSEGASHVSEVAYPPLASRWNYETFSKIMANPVAASGRVFVGNNAGAFYAFDAFTGNVLWQFSAGGRIDSAACYYDGAVYFGSRDGFVYALDADTGSVLWSRNLGTLIISSPVIFEGKLFIGEGSASNSVIILNAGTGQILGSFPTGQPVHSSVSFLENKFFVTSNDGALYCGNIDNYSQIWPEPYQTAGSFERSSPLVFGSSVFIAPAHDEKKVYKINIDTGLKLDESNELTADADRAGSPGISNGVVFVSIGWTPVKLFALDASDLSNKLWEYSIGSITSEDSVPNPTLTQNCVYTPTFDGKIVALKQDNAALLYDNSISNNSIHAQIAVSNGWIYVGVQEGTVKAYKASQILSIFSPADYEVVSSTTVGISGTILIQDLSYSSLAYGQGEDPPEWVNISNKYGSFENSSLAQWYTDGLDDGLYTIRLTAVTVPASVLTLESRVVVRVNLPPEAPTDLVLTDAPNGFALTWTKSADDGACDNDVSEYRIYRSTAPGEYSGYLAAVSNGTVGYTDDTVQPAKQYYYRIKSYDGLTESGFSNEVHNVLLTETDWELVPCSTGGTVDLPDGTEAVMPAGTFDEDVYVKIKILQKNEYIDTGDNIMFNGTAIAREFSILTDSQINAMWELPVSQQGAFITAQSSSVKFNKLAAITIPYKLNEISGMDEQKLRIALWNGSNAKWGVNQTSSVNTDDLRVQALVNHFSTYRVVENNWVGVSCNEGESVELLDGTKAVIEPGTFAEDVWVYIKKLEAGDYNSAGVDPRFKSLDAARRFYVMTNQQMNIVSGMAQAEQASLIKTYSASMNFGKLVKIIIPYQPSLVKNQSLLRMIWYDENALQWKLVNTSMPDAGSSCVQAAVSHFSDYQAVEFVPIGDLLEKDKVYTYPNPAKGDTLYFKFYSGDDSFIEIDVYNIAGERVAHLTGEGSAGLVSEIPWDIRKYASGIYVYTIEAKQKAGNSKKKIIKKLAIIK